ncbi:IS701 family transposase, partial [Actinocorallia lasiicapitis]
MPPPFEDNGAVTTEALDDWRAEFDLLCARFEARYYRTESREHFRQYLRGLLAPLARKNSWTISEFTGERRPTAIQRFINLTPWDENALRDDVRSYVMEHLADSNGILIVDPTGFAKKGKKSAGVQRQYSGTLGRIDNCQIGVFLAYANSSGDRALIDRELYLPETSWCRDAERRAEAGIPQDVAFATRPQQAQVMISRAIEAGVPFAWLAADEEFGQNPGFRAYLESRQIAYAVAVPKTTDTTTFSVSKYSSNTVETLAATLHPEDWIRRSCGIGIKGFRVYDWAAIPTSDPDHQLIFRRNITDGELSYFHCHNPRHADTTELVRVIGGRWPIEECFEAAKQEAGLDHYQFRLYRAWYRHISMAMLAMAFLAVLRHSAKKGDL